jgi:hypothetical protein
VGGALDLARMVWSGWSFEDKILAADLARRGVEDSKTLPGYLYREDAGQIWQALHEYAERVLSVWYRRDEDVRADWELRAWADELARWIPDFPSRREATQPHRIETRGRLVDVVTAIIFRASAQHSAVNNGQYEMYGFVPNAPGTVYAGLPGVPIGTSYDERDVLEAMPGTTQGFGQLGMTWVLSQPTHRSLPTSGESPAFREDVCFEARQGVSDFRARLQLISKAIEERNAALDVPYTYLDPQNVGRSTAV